MISDSQSAQEALATLWPILEEASAKREAEEAAKEKVRKVAIELFSQVRWEAVPSSLAISGVIRSSKRIKKCKDINELDRSIIAELIKEIHENVCDQFEVSLKNFFRKASATPIDNKGTEYRAKLLRVLYFGSTSLSQTNDHLCYFELTTKADGLGGLESLYDKNMMEITKVSDIWRIRVFANLDRFRGALEMELESDPKIMKWVLAP
jgi:hypothetical protein